MGMENKAVATRGQGEPVCRMFAQLILSDMQELN